MVQNHSTVGRALRGIPCLIALAMSFVHLHAPHAKPAAADLCLVINADRLLARADITEAVVLPNVATLDREIPVSKPPMHIGQLDGRPVWLYVIEAADSPAPAGWQWHDTRTLLTVLSPDQFHAISCARQLSWWRHRHQFCGVCGTPTVEVAEERARRCPKCSALFFPVVSSAIIVAVTREDEILLAHNRNFRPGMYSVLAGFVDPGETLEQAVAREVREEVGVELTDIDYIASQPWPFPNSLMLGFRARYVRGEIAVDGKEIEHAGWYKRTALPEIPRRGSVARSLIDGWIQGVHSGGRR